MLLLQRESGIHAVRSGTGDAGVAGARFHPRLTPAVGVAGATPAPSRRSRDPWPRRHGTYGTGVADVRFHVRSRSAEHSPTATPGASHLRNRTPRGARPGARTRKPRECAAG